nr:hypothetical protein [Candidatus Njordarchaeota archaeon]
MSDKSSNREITIVSTPKNHRVFDGTEGILTNKTKKTAVQLLREARTRERKTAFFESK